MWKQCFNETLLIYLDIDHLVRVYELFSDIWEAFRNSGLSFSSFLIVLFRFCAILVAMETQRVTSVHLVKSCPVRFDNNNICFCSIFLSGFLKKFCLFFRPINTLHLHWSVNWSWECKKTHKTIFPWHCIEIPLYGSMWETTWWESKPFRHVWEVFPSSSF